MEKKQILTPDQMIYSIEDLKKEGLTYYKINQMINEGAIIKLNKKYYENKGYNGEESDFIYVSAYVPKGVICLMSAATFYNLTTYRPDSVNVAIQRKARISTMPDWPRISLHYFSEERYETGISVVNVKKNQFRIYNIEKTVADIVSYKEKIGIEETKEILVTYLRKKDRNINQLLRYAELLKCDEIMKTYLEVLI